MYDYVHIICFIIDNKFFKNSHNVHNQIFTQIVTYSSFFVCT